MMNEWWGEKWDSFVYVLIKVLKVFVEDWMHFFSSRMSRFQFFSFSPRAMLKKFVSNLIRQSRRTIRICDTCWKFFSTNRQKKWPSPRYSTFLIYNENWSLVPLTTFSIHHNFMMLHLILYTISIYSIYYRSTCVSWKKNDFLCYQVEMR